MLRPLLKSFNQADAYAYAAEWLIEGRKMWPVPRWLSYTVFVHVVGFKLELRRFISCMYICMYWIEAQAPQLDAGGADGVSSALPAGELYPPRPIVKVWTWSWSWSWKVGSRLKITRCDREKEVLLEGGLLGWGAVECSSGKRFVDIEV